MVIISRVSNIKLMWEYNFDKIINLIPYQIKNIISIELPLKIKEIINKYKYWNKLKIIYLGL